MKTKRHWSPVHAGILLGIFALLTLGGLAQSSIFTTSVTIGIFALIALPLGLLYGQGGTISLAQGAFAALGAYTTAICTTRYGLSPMMTLLPAMLVPALLAFVIARPILRLPELSLALVTLSLGTVVQVALERGGDFTNNYIGISGIPLLPFIGSSVVGAHIMIWSLVLIGVLFYSCFIASARGRALNAVRVDRLLAESVGVNVAMDLSILFAGAAGIAGLAGWFYAHFIGYIAPTSLNVAVSAHILFMVVVGGRKAVLGPILGAIIFTFSNDLLPGTQIQGLFFGTLLILVLMFFPDGVLSLSWRRLKAMFGKSDANGTGTDTESQLAGGSAR